MSKEKALLELALLRQKTRYEGYKSIADYLDGFYECEYVSPYSKSAHNVNADVMVVLQDWSSDENMQVACEETNRIGHTPTVGTNVKLISLLERFLKLDLSETYATNLFPFIKMGGMSAYMPVRDLRRAAHDFTLPMIDIIEPKIVIALGRKTYQALLSAARDKAVDKQGSFIYKKTRVFHQPHPAARISNEKKERGWSEMALYFDQISKN